MSLKFLSNQTTDNKIGIGTNVPNANLEVSFPDNTNIQRWSYSPAKTDYYLELDSYIPTGGVVGYSFDMKNSGTSYNDVLTMREGKVGIGTRSPGAKLDVDGSIRLSTSGAVEGRSYPYTTNIGSGANATTTYIKAGSSSKTEIELSGGDTNSNIVFKTPTSGNVTTTALTLDTSQNATFANDVGMVTGHSSGKFAVLSTSVHGSYDFYNNGTSYLNGTVIVDAAFAQTGGLASTFTGLVSGITPVASANFVTKAYVDGSGGGTGPFLPLAGGTMTGDLKLNDNVVAKFGTGDDLRIQHSSGGGGAGYIQNYTGDLQIQNRAVDKDILFRCDDGNGVTTSYLVLDGSTTHAYFSNPGNVGIGTTNPGQKLQISGGNSATSATALFSIQKNEEGYGLFSGILGSGVTWIQSSTETESGYYGLSLQPNGGNVGIGTATPDFKLDVDGTLGVSDLPFNTDSVSVLVADETLGADTVTNGDFATNTDWTEQGGAAAWSIANGKANCVVNSSTRYFEQPNVLASSGPGYTYKIVYTISGMTQGTFQINVGGYGATPGRTANGTYAETFTTVSASSNNRIYLQSNPNTIGSIDNISVQLITSASDQIQKRELGTGAFGPTPVGAYLPLAGGTMTAGAVVTFLDSSGSTDDRLKFGSGGDMQLFHDGTASHIVSSGSDLRIDVPNFIVRSASGTESIIRATQNAAVELYYNNSKKFETTDIGVTFSNLATTSAASSSVDEVKIGTFGAGRPALFFGTSNTTYGNSTWFIENIGASGKFRIGRNGLDVIEISNSGDTTFAGNVSLQDNKELIFGSATDFKIYHNSTTNVNHVSSQLDRQLSINGNIINLTNQANTASYLVLNSTSATFLNNASFGQYTTMRSAQTEYAYVNLGATGTYGWQIGKGPSSGGVVGNESFYLYNFADTSVALEVDTSNNATFSTQAFATTATSTGDASSTLTTKGYVDGLITGATIYRGTWDPDITANSGNGTPDLSTVTQTSGYYYICSDIGTAHPNGTTGSPAVPCEPNSWAVGDWVIWNDDVPDCAGTGTGAWQKIDNTSVLSGIGTGQTVALWEGAGSVTDSETLGNAPITVSGNDTTFAQDITARIGNFKSPDATSSTLMNLMANDGSNAATFRTTATGKVFEIKSQNSGTLKFDSTSSTFTGNVGIGGPPLGNPGTDILSVGVPATTAGGIQLWAGAAQTHYLQFGDANSAGEVYRGGIGYAHASETLLLLQGSATALSFTGLQAATFPGTVLFNDHTTHPDQVNSYFGTGNDASIQHNGSHLFIDNSVGSSYIRNTSTGDILLRNSTGGDIQFDNEFAGNILFNTSNVERMRISSAGAIKFNAYNSTNNTGTPTYILGTDASGNVVKVLGADIPGVPAGSGANKQVTYWTGTDTIDGDDSFKYELDASNNTLLDLSSTGSQQIRFFDTNSTYTESMRLLRFDDKLIMTYGDNANEEALTVVGTGSTAGNVGIGTTAPKAKLDVNGHFCVDSKAHTITNAFTDCLTVNLNNHTGCHVVITVFGDWPGHSSAGYRGEFFLQNGANAYAEPGIILRQDDNTSTGTDQIICQIVDPTSTANPKDFQIQIRHTDTTSPASWTGQLTYTVQGQFNSIT